MRAAWLAVGLVAVLAAGAVTAWRTGVFSSATAPGAAPPGAPAPATAAVTWQHLSATTPVTATLGYAGSYIVTGQGTGTLTWLPPPGRVIRPGQALYRTGNGSPVVLLDGSVPDWRSLSPGTAGEDVSQLNHDLVDLGYADQAEVTALGWGYYSWETSYAVQRLETHLGVDDPPGSLALGQVVFEPEALRVSQVTGRLGGPAAGPVLAATSDRRVVTIPLDAAMQTQVKAGDPVTVALPTGATVPGAVSSVGTVATTTAPGATSGRAGYHDPGPGDADRAARGGHPGPGAGDGEHDHAEQSGPGARRAGDGAGGPVDRRLRRRGDRPGEYAPLGPGDARDL